MQLYRPSPNWQIWRAKCCAAALSTLLLQFFLRWIYTRRRKPTVANWPRWQCQTWWHLPRWGLSPDTMSQSQPHHLAPSTFSRNCSFLQQLSFKTHSMPLSQKMVELSYFSAYLSPWSPRWLSTEWFTLLRIQNPRATRFLEALQTANKAQTTPMYCQRWCISPLHILNPSLASNCKPFGGYDGAYTPELAQHSNKSFR